MSTVVTNIACTAYYQVSLSYGTSCTEACQNTSYVTYYTDCSSLNVGCQILNSSGTDALFGFYSDGTYCYEYGVDLNVSELTTVISKEACLTENCGCFGFSISDCAEAGTNYTTYC